MKEFFTKAALEIGNALQSFWLVPITFAFAFFCWYFEFTLLLLGVFVALFVSILIFCKDVKNIFALVLYVYCFLQDIYTEGTNWTLYLILIGLAVAILIAFLIVRCVRSCKSITLGKMFYSLLILDAAFLLGGVIGHFDIINTLVTLAACVATYVLYFIARNFTKNLLPFLYKLFVVGGLVVSIQVFISEEAFFSAQTLNTSSVYLLLGLVGCFGLGLRTKWDWLYMPLTFLFAFAVFCTRCRMVILITAPFIIVTTVLFIVYSKKRKEFWHSAIIIAVGVVILGLFFEQLVKPHLDSILNKINGGNITSGRDDIFAVCIECIKQSPVFGIGFILEDNSTARGEIYLLLAHNTALQWVTSLGILGAALTVLFYIRKYKLVFNRFNIKKVAPMLAILGIAFSGITDQAASMDFFMFLYPLIILAGIEGRTKRKTIVKKEKYPPRNELAVK